MLNDLLGKKLKNTKINGLKTNSGETLTNTNKITNYTNTHFAAIGPNLASKISTDEDNVSPEQFLTKRDPSFYMYFKGVDFPRVLQLLNGIKIAKATGVDTTVTALLDITNEWCSIILTKV